MNRKFEYVCLTDINNKGASHFAYLSLLFKNPFCVLSFGLHYITVLVKIPEDLKLPNGEGMQFCNSTFIISNNAHE